MKRAPSAELLDADAGTPAEIAASFSDLRLVNRCFGGNHATLAMIERAAAELKKNSLSLLEVAAGSGDVARSAQRSLARRGLQLSLTLLDRQPSHLLTGSANGTPKVVADALSLPFRDASFDLVGCSLFTHHLAPGQVVQFVNEALRVCRDAVLVNDLVRSPWHLALVYAGLPLFRSRLTRNDSVASVRQSYVPREMKTLLQSTKAARIDLRRHFLFRMTAVIWKTRA